MGGGDRCRTSGEFVPSALERQPPAVEPPGSSSKGVVMRRLLATSALIALGAGIGFVSSPSAATPNRNAPAPKIVEVSTPLCGPVPIFAGAAPALNPDPGTGTSDPAAFDRQSGLPFGGAWCFN
jgi:hypothetical protein